LKSYKKPIGISNKYAKSFPLALLPALTKKPLCKHSLKKLSYFTANLNYGKLTLGN
jgi:hypothetical protein